MLLDCWISSPEKCLTEVSISLGTYNRFSAVFQMIHCNNGFLQNRRLDIQNLGYVSCSLFLGCDIQYLKWLKMQRHALSSIQLNQQNYQAPYSVYCNGLSQCQASSSSRAYLKPVPVLSSCHFQIIVKPGADPDWVPWVLEHSEIYHHFFFTEKFNFSCLLSRVF